MVLLNTSHATHTTNALGKTAATALQVTVAAGIAAGVSSWIKSYSEQALLGLQTVWGGLVLYQIHNNFVQLEQTAQLIYELDEAIAANKNSLTELAHQVTQNPSESVIHQFETVHMHGENLQQQLHAAEKQYVALQGNLTTLTSLALTAVGTTGVAYGKIGWDAIQNAMYPPFSRF